MAVVEKSKNIEQEVRYRVYPDIDSQVDYQNRTIDIEIALPGVAKEDIHLKFLPDWFYLDAKRDEIEYSGSFNLGTTVDPEKTTAKYSNGLLKVHAVIANPMDSAKTLSF